MKNKNLLSKTTRGVVAKVAGNIKNILDNDYDMGGNGNYIATLIMTGNDIEASQVYRCDAIDPSLERLMKNGMAVVT